MKILYNTFKNINNRNISGITDDLKAVYINYLFQNSNDNILVLTNSLFEATKYYEMLKTLSSDVFLFPMDEFLTSVAIAMTPDLIVKRLETLNTIDKSKKQIIITNLMGYLKFIPNNQAIDKYRLRLKTTENVNRKNLEEILQKFGYNKTSLVTSTGEYSIRGYIIDLFPYNYDHPIRIEMFGNSIESLKTFNEESQLSISNLNEIEVIPFKEIIGKEYTNLYSILAEPIVVKIEPESIINANKLLENQIKEYKATQNKPSDYKYMYSLSEIKPKKEYNLSSFNLPSYEDLKSGNIEKFNSNFDLLKRFVELNIDKYSIIFSIQNKNIKEKIKETFNITPSDNYQLAHIYLEEDFNLNGFILKNYIIITEKDICGNLNKLKYTNPIKIGRKIKGFNDLKKGDYVVHSMHGIGIYGGIITLTKNNISKDYILINYRDNDKVYIPVEKITTIYKYADKDGTPPKINKLNSTEWFKTKSRVKSRLKDISKELLTLYAQRASIKSPKFKEFPEETLFESQFIYNPTKDQIKCISDILNDLRTDKPMDRLLCGDVGFGKTEVAFRGIFNTIINGYQVAYLCPTTILSKQQYNSALERFKDFPVNIAIVNRFTTTKTFKEITNKLEEGKIDLLIGTHKLFNEKINFKNLGLLVVDEEQRFGVSQKEKIKGLSKNVNVLTLSATPIPRTLKMALSGLKDLSILDTAPEERYPIQTYVIEQSDMFIKEAIYKELSRKGQIYYLYNNVSKIESEVTKLKRLVPEAKICYAHGQMSKEQLETIFEDFIDKKYDILVCTTIIETGIDISNVNTLIIIDAQNYGLSQLYQLRGRVGRSNKIAYAYLTYNNSKILSEIAIKRLKAITEFTELGSGYKIAMRDLAIRGAGDLLGSDQAGFIDSVGIELYTKLIEETLNELKGIIEEEETIETSLINVDTHIDDDYVSDEDVKIEIHQLINKIEDYESLTRIKNEIEDRFGKINEKMEIYMYEEWFEKLATKLKINKIIEARNNIEVYLPQELSSKMNGEKLFIKLYNINPKFKIRYFAKSIILSLPTINQDKHYLYYLVEILEEILNDIE